MKRSLVLTMLLFSGGPLWAAQRTFVSAGNGVDTNPCSRALPCRTFNAAIPLADAGGEVVALDSGGYGPATIDHSLSLIAPAGIQASITAPATGIYIGADDTSDVVIRNISMSELPAFPGSAQSGISTGHVRSVSIENCVLDNFGTAIDFDPLTQNARLYVSGTKIRGGGSNVTMVGVSVVGAGHKAVVDSTQIYGAESGVLADYSASVFVRDTLVTGANYAVASRDSGTIVADGVAINGSVNAFYAAQTSTMILSRCRSDGNTTGLFAAGTAYVSNSTFANNNSGVFVQSGGAAISRGNNTLQSNASQGAFSGLYSAQ